MNPLSPNVIAFLAMLSHSEGTDRATDPYRVCYGFKHTISDLGFHPAEPRPPDGVIEWPGESLASLGVKYENERSTAAGRYQINLPTYLENKQELIFDSFDTLDEPITFDAASQNIIVVNILRRVVALDDVEDGYIATAIAKCKGKWASLPGGNSGQPEKAMADLTDRFTMAGGSLA